MWLSVLQLRHGSRNGDAAPELPSMDPYGKVVGAMLRPATLVLMGITSAAAIGHAFQAPFPASGGNPVLDLIA